MFYTKNDLQIEKSRKFQVKKKIRLFCACATSINLGNLPFLIARQRTTVGENSERQQVTM